MEIMIPFMHDDKDMFSHQCYDSHICRFIHNDGNDERCTQFIPILYTIFGIRLRRLQIGTVTYSVYVIM